MILDLQSLKAAHTHSIFNRSEIEESDYCGCFGCMSVLAANDIRSWIPEGKGKECTAECPECDLDAVIGDASGFPVKKGAFLRTMHELWCTSDEDDESDD